MGIRRNLKSSYRYVDEEFSLLLAPWLLCWSVVDLFTVEDHHICRSSTSNCRNCVARAGQPGIKNQSLPTSRSPPLFFRPSSLPHLIFCHHYSYSPCDISSASSVYSFPWISFVAQAVQVSFAWQGSTSTIRLIQVELVGITWHQGDWNFSYDVLN